MPRNILIETSARHLHLSRKDLDVLFGEGYELTNKKDLSQPGEFACEERVKVQGKKGSLNITILGPVRSATQIEVSNTDARALGVVPPVRVSGDVAGSPGAKLIGPKGEVEISQGIIVAKRHMHLTPEDAKAAGISDKQIVKVAFEGERGVTFHEVVVRVSDKFSAAMHIDTDEANAAGISGNVTGTIIV